MATFGLVSGLMLFGSVSQYIVTTRVRTAVDQAQFLARACAIELARLSGDLAVRLAAGFMGKNIRRMKRSLDKFFLRSRHSICEFS